MTRKKPPIGLETHSFQECVEKVDSLAELRADYANQPADERRAAADWEYHSSAPDDYELARNNLATVCESLKCLPDGTD